MARGRWGADRCVIEGAVGEGFFNFGGEVLSSGRKV